MNSNTNQRTNEIRFAEDIRDEMDLEIMDARSLLTAIEALFANSAVGEGGGHCVNNNDIHCLVLIARDKARKAESLSNDLEVALMTARRAA